MRHSRSCANIRTSMRQERQLTGKMTSLILPSADMEMMNLFLEHVSKTEASYFVVMQVDQAGWHQSKDLQIPAHMRLLAQPAYSPELNPVKSRPLTHSPHFTPCCLRRHIYSQRIPHSLCSVV
jgi:hypothetical protein